MNKLEARQDYVLDRVNADELGHLYASAIYLGVNDSPDNYIEIFRYKPYVPEEGYMLAKKYEYMENPEECPLYECVSLDLAVETQDDYVVVDSNRKILESQNNFE